MRQLVQQRRRACLVHLRLDIQHKSIATFLEAVAMGDTHDLACGAPVMRQLVQQRRCACLVHLHTHIQHRFLVTTEAMKVPFFQHLILHFSTFAGIGDRVPP